MNELVDVLRLRVRFSEVDALRRAWHGAFVAFFEDGRESFGRHYPGIGYSDMVRAEIGAPVYDLHVRYLAPLPMGEVAVLHTSYVYRPGARFDFGYRLFRESDGVLCAEGETVQLFIDAAGELMLERPDFYQAWQAKYLRAGDEECGDLPLSGR